MPDATAESNRDAPRSATQAPATPPPPGPEIAVLGAPSSTRPRHEPVGTISGAPLRPGHFTVGWQIMVAGAWTAAFFAYAAVWKTSEEIGIGTWWLGARSQPQPTPIRVAPFVITLFVAMLAVYNVRRVAWLSAAFSVALGIGAAFDMSRSGGLAAIEFAIAGCMLLVSIGAIFGAVRPTQAS